MRVCYYEAVKCCKVSSLVVYFSEAGGEQHTLEHLSHSLEELVHVRPLEDIHLQTHTLYLNTPTHMGTFMSEYTLMLVCEHSTRKSCDPSERLLLAGSWL